MIQVSNTDFAQAISLLKAFSSSPGKTRRELNDRRKASLIVKKWSKQLCTAKETASPGKAPTASNPE